MRAIASRSYGPLDRLAAVDLPTPDPSPNQALVRVHAAAINPADYKVILGDMKLLHARNFPMVLGYDFSGTVEATGREVSGLAHGSEVFGFLPYGPGNRRGSFAEYLVADVTELAQKPRGVSISSLRPPRHQVSRRCKCCEILRVYRMRTRACSLRERPGGSGP